MAKINILFVSSAVKISGAERVLLSILKNLNKEVFLPTVLISEEGIFFDELKKIGIKVIKSKAVKKLNFLKMSFWLGGIKFYNPLVIIVNIIFVVFYFFSALIEIIFMLRKIRADLLHINSTDIAIRFFLAAYFVKKPLIFHYHDILRPNIENLFLRWLIDLPSKVICVSNAGRRSLIKWTDKVDKIKTIYNSVDLTLFNGNFDLNYLKALKESLKLDKTVVGMVGRLDELKGHETFLEAASKVVNAVEGVSFLIIGSWVLNFEKKRLEILEQYAEKLKIRDKVVFTGFVSNVSRYYHLMDVVVVPSWQEPFGLVPLEALSSKRAVIATNTGGTPELITDKITGILIPPKNAQILAQSIIKLLKNEPLRNRLASQGCKETGEFFNPLRFMKELEDVYKQAVVIN